MRSSLLFGGLCPGRLLNAACGLPGQILVELFRFLSPCLDIGKAFLLFGRKLHQPGFQLQGLFNVGAVAVEGVNAFALLDAEVILLRQVIDSGQFIGPSFPVVPAGQLFQNSDLVLVASSVGFDDLVLQDEPLRIVGIEVHIFIVAGQGEHVIIQFEFQFAHGEKDLAVLGRPLPCQAENVTAVLETPVDLVQVGDPAQGPDAPDLAPVDYVSNLGGLTELPGVDQSVDLTYAGFIFILIQISFLSDKLLIQIQFSIGPVQCQNSH